MSTLNDTAFTTSATDSMYIAQSSQVNRLPQAEKNTDPNVVDWNGPSDPANPLNWSKRQRNLHVVFVSFFTLYANLAATMFSPGATQLATEFRTTSTTIEALTVSIYVAGFSIGPLFLALLSELYGRLIIYHCCNIVYTVFTAGCAFSTNTVMFLVFRIFCVCAASGPMSIGGGTVADMTRQEDRGAAMALFAVGPLLGPVAGPAIGGFVSQVIGWRWTFRLILIMSGVLGIASLVFLREANATLLLRRKAERLRKGTGNLDLVAKPDAKANPKLTPGQMLFRAVVRPTKMLIFSPIVLLLSTYTALLFGLIFLLFTTLPSVIEETYKFSTGLAGLSYLGLGLGMLFGLVLFAVLSDKLLDQKKDTLIAQPELRLILMKWFAPITPLGCFLYGWSAYYRMHWIVPIIGTFIIGFGALFVVIPAQVYLVDAFGSEAAASALAANLVLRSPFGAFLPLTAPSLYAKLGLGWGNTLLGFLCLAFTPVPWLFLPLWWILENSLRTRAVR